MKTTLGNYLTQGNKDFPVDAETFDYIQQNQALLSILGNIAGDKAVLYGCEQEQNGTGRKAGYVFIRTKDFPEGEILYWEGGSISAGMYLNKEIVAVSAQGYEYPQAYTIRSLKPGIGEENFKWADMKDISTIPKLEQTIAALRTDIAALTPPPLGIVQIWAGAKVPENYELCEGQQLKITDYPDLYAAIGATYNNSYDANGNKVSTTSGYFRLPDLRGRFLVGYNVSDADYNTYGKVGGEKKHILTTDELPSHVHSTKDYYFAEHIADASVHTGVERMSKKVRGCGDSDSDNEYLYYYTHDTETAGKGQTHENRPPYYTLAYIMRVK